MYVSISFSLNCTLDVVSHSPCALQLYHRSDLFRLLNLYHPLALTTLSAAEFVSANSEWFEYHYDLWMICSIQRHSTRRRSTHLRARRILAELRDGQSLRFSHFFVCFMAQAVFGSSLDLTHSDERALCEAAAPEEQSDQLDRARMLMWVELLPILLVCTILYEYVLQYICKLTYRLTSEITCVYTRYSTYCIT